MKKMKMKKENKMKNEEEKKNEERINEIMNKKK